MSKPQVEEFGWTAVPRNRSNMPSESSAKTTPVPVNFDSIWPKTNVVKQAQEHVKKILPTQTYNHSLRVYCYGHTLVSQHFPEWIAASKSDFFETWALTCLYHDIATTDEHRGDTHMSFEWHGGFMALQELQSFGAPRAQAESVCEAIIRHQDPGETGTISRMGQLVQIATEFDNMGWQAHLVHEDVIKQVVEQHPRLKWSGCFSKAIKAEIEAKPWCHTTVIPGFSEAVANNKLMERYD
ncbi:hypothetical protein Q7P36_006036 [Cladosporium allicinum]